jgi:hypothetical protein
MMHKPISWCAANLCLIACPNNRILDQISRFVCEPYSKLSGNDDEPLTVVFDEDSTSSVGVANAKRAQER